MSRSCSAARQCHGAGRRRFHWHAHRRVTPHGGAGSYRPRERSPNTAVSSQDQVHPQPQTRGAQCAHAGPRAPRLTARRATPPTPPPSHPRGAGPRLAQFSLRAMDCALSPDQHLQAQRLGSPATTWWPSAPATGRRSRTRSSYGEPSTSPGAPSPGSPLPAAGDVTWPGSTRPLPRWWCWPRPTTSCWPRPAASPLRPGHALYQPTQPAGDTPPGRRLHGRTEAQALGDADVCYNLPPASDGLRRIRRRRQAALPAVPGRS